jgi:hypothetical protein
MTGHPALRTHSLRAALLTLVVAASACSSEPVPRAAAVANAGTTGGDERETGVAGGGGIPGRADDARGPRGGAGEADVSQGLGDVRLGAAGAAGAAESPGGPADASVGNLDGNDAGVSGERGPLDRVVLFDGTNLDEWRSSAGNGEAPWELAGDGTMVVVPGSGSVATRRTFDDLFVHVEYKTPALPANVTGQDRGNSGVYLNSRYEVQILDSFGLPPAADSCGAIYQLSPPSSTACYEQEVWNTYDLEFQAARWDAQGNKQANARVFSAYLNGVLVQENVDIPNSTGLGEPEAPGPRPLVLQEHGNRVAFRNVWVIER